MLLALAALQFYPFAVDQDGLRGAPDFSFLNRPLEEGDRVVARDGHFCRAGDGARVRFFGVNLAFGANFPAAEDAVRIAKRLRRLGVNLVRLHHMDSQPDANPANSGSLLTTGPYPTLNQVAVTRLRTFLNALKAEGIYANLNLHVGYAFRPAVDGLPAMPAGVAFPTQSKPLHIFYPRMVELQAEYTRAVLDALELRGDPVLAMVEIDNETSLVQAWQSNQLEKTAVGDYAEELRRQWNQYLSERYGSTEALRAAWGGGGGDGPELLPSKWVTEVHAPAQGSIELSDGVVKATVTRGGAWLYLKQVGFSVAAGEPYLGEVEMRAEKPGQVTWDVKQDVSPWRSVTSKRIEVSAGWRKFTLGFEPAFAMNGVGRFALDVGAAANTYYIRNWSLRRAARQGLGAGQSLEAGSVELVTSSEIPTDRRINDYLQFLAGRDRAYLEQMMAAVRERAAPDTPVAGTQMGFGGLLNLDSHAGLDYQDNHFYVDHYNFPGTAWDDRNWRIRDDSAVGGGLSSILNMAAAREAWRPYTVSEFNQPWPNRQAAEIDPALAAFAAFQDWDAIVHFAYEHGRGWDTAVPNGFNIDGDWTKWPNIGQAAWLFRTGAVRAGVEYVEIPVSESARLRAARERRGGNIAQYLNASMGYDPAMALIHRVGISRDDWGRTPDALAVKLAQPYESDTGELVYDRARKLLVLRGAQAAGVIGFAAGSVNAGVMELEAEGFLTAVLTPLDGRPLSESGRMLLTTPGYALRTQPGSDPPRPQQLVHYTGAADWWTLEPEPNSARPSGSRSGGTRPVWMSRVESRVTLRVDGTVTVYPLDGAGQRLAALPVEKVDGGTRIDLQAEGQQWAPWYEVVVER